MIQTPKYCVDQGDAPPVENGRFFEEEGPALYVTQHGTGRR